VAGEFILKGSPIHRGFLGRLGADQNHVDPTHVIATFAVGRGSGFEEADFTDQQRVRVAKDRLTDRARRAKLSLGITK
jgi:hypothetical protein